MRAARFYGQRDIRIEDIPLPEAKDREVLISVEWCGICGTDLHEYTHGPAAIPHGKPHAITGCVAPVTMGHEFCGRVLRAPEASSLKVGQSVMVDPRIYCNSCSACGSSATNMCDSWGFLGLSGGGGGGLSETVAVSQDMCYALPDTADLKTAALLEPLAVAWHALRISGARASSQLSALIVGGGPIGLAVALVLRAHDARGIYISEPTQKRRDQAVPLVEKVFDPIHDQVSETILSMTGGRGVDLVFDCAGAQPGMNEGMKALALGGTYVNVAAWSKQCELPQGLMMRKELGYKGSFAYADQDFREVVQAFTEGKFEGIESLVTGRIHLDDVVEKGFEELLTKKDDHVKILVTPRKEILEASS